MMHMKHFDKADMEKHMAQMCQNHYAKAVGKLAELEVKLDLTAKQKPLYERWKGNLLSAAKEFDGSDLDLVAALGAGRGERLRSFHPLAQDSLDGR